MKARTLIVAAILAGSSSALQARDYGSGDLAVARAFFWLMRLAAARRSRVMM